MKKTHVILVIIAAVLSALLLSLKLSSNWNRARAREVAEAYLKTHYDEVMVYEGIRFSWIDPSLYHVFFHPEANPELQFDVEVLPKSFHLTKFPDNYMTQMFKFRFEKEYGPVIQNLWGEETKLVVSESTRVVEETTPDMTLSQMSQTRQYRLTIYPNIAREMINPEEEQKRVFALIERLQNDDISFEELSIGYLKKDSDAGRVNHEYEYVRIEEPGIIESIDDIEK